MAYAKQDVYFDFFLLKIYMFFSTMPVVSAIVKCPEFSIDYIDLKLLIIFC